MRHTFLHNQGRHISSLNVNATRQLLHQTLTPGAKLSIITQGGIGRLQNLSTRNKHSVASNRPLNNSQSKSVQSFKDLLAQKGSKCACFKQEMSLLYSKSVKKDMSGHHTASDDCQKKCCGDYCKKLSAEEQRRIVTRLMLVHHRLWKIEAGRESTHMSSSRILLTQEQLVDGGVGESTKNLV